MYVLDIWCPQFCPNGELAPVPEGKCCPSRDLCPLQHCQGISCPPKVGYPQIMLRDVLILQTIIRDAPPETWLQSHETPAVRAKLSATTPTAPRCFSHTCQKKFQICELQILFCCRFAALLSAAVTAQLLRFPKASVALARGLALLRWYAQNCIWDFGCSKYSIC